MTGTNPNGLLNFRDFGGCPTEAGPRVKRDRLYRSGQFAHTHAEALATLLDLDFQLIVDLRDATERTKVPSPWPPRYVNRLICHDTVVTATPPHLALLGSDKLTPRGIARYYEALYAEMPFDPDYRSLFASAIRRLADTTGRALIHCAVGKDRTGILCALLLSVLRVPREAIMADFLRSSKATSLIAMKSVVVAWAHKQYGQQISAETVDALLDVDPTYLQATFTRIEREYGSVAGYLAAGGVSRGVIDRLHHIYLE